MNGIFFFAARYASEILSRISHSKTYTYGKIPSVGGEKPTPCGAQDTRQSAEQDPMDIEIDFYTNPSQIYRGPPHPPTEEFQNPIRNQHQHTYTANSSSIRNYSTKSESPLLFHLI